MSPFRRAIPLRRAGSRGRAVLLPALAVLAIQLSAPPPAAAGAAPAPISGVVTAVDLDARTMTVKDPAAGAVLVLVPDNAVIVLDGDEQAVLEDVFEGDIVENATLRDLGQGKVALVKAVVSTAPEEGEEDEAPPEPAPSDPAPPKRP
jgi:hypothetical protein